MTPGGREASPRTSQLDAAASERDVLCIIDQSRAEELGRILGTSSRLVSSQLLAGPRCHPQHDLRQPIGKMPACRSGAWKHGQLCAGANCNFALNSGGQAVLRKQAMSLLASQKLVSRVLDLLVKHSTSWLCAYVIA
jgi:hypothetical protein